MSVWYHLWELFGQDNVLQIGTKEHIDAFKEEDPDRLKKYAALGGHHWLSTYRDKIDNLDGYYKVTTLRDPIDRVISSYNFIRKSKFHRQYNEANSKAFEEFTLTEMPNMQTRLISGVADYQKAVEILDKWFDFYTTCDQVDLLLKKLSEVGTAPFKKGLHKNISKKKVTRQSIEPALLSRLENLHQEDVKLFDYVQGRQATLPERLTA